MGDGVKMSHRRLFIVRKDLNMSPGKLAAQVAHCAEAYWTKELIKNAVKTDEGYSINLIIDKDIFDNYLNDIFTKTICEAKNKNHLLKAYAIAIDLGLKENIDFGLIYDACLTELTPEESDGTTLTGIWFKPLEDSIAHKISKKYQLYR